MYSALDNTALPVLGFPIRKSAGQCLFSDSPRLIAAVHVLLRLLVPRHPPCALTILTVSSACARGRLRSTTIAEAIMGEYPFTFLALMQFSSSVEVGWRVLPAGGLSKLSSASNDDPKVIPLHGAKSVGCGGPVDI